MNFSCEDFYDLLYSYSSESDVEDQNLNPNPNPTCHQDNQYDCEYNSYIPCQYDYYLNCNAKAQLCICNSNVPIPDPNCDDGKSQTERHFCPSNNNYIIQGCCEGAETRCGGPCGKIHRRRPIGGLSYWNCPHKC